jgi:mono/diheme cytochrome c family protein
MKRAKLILSLGLAAIAAPALAQNNAGPAAAQHGHDVFLNYGCWECHGTVGQGGAGPALLPKLPAFAVFETFVRQGSPAGMLPYSPKMMPEDDLNAAYAYLKSQPAPPHPAVLFPAEK